MEAIDLRNSLQDDLSAATTRTGTCHSDIYSFFTYRFDQRPVFFEFLPENRALLVSHEYLWIYAIPELKPTKELTIANPSTLVPIHTIPLPGSGFRRGGLSRPSMDSQHTRFALYTGSGVYGLVIPHNDICPPSASTLTKFAKIIRGNACVGLRRAVIRLPGGLVSTQSYPYPGTSEIGLTNDGAPTANCQIPPNIDHRALLLMDEGTGRIVQPQYVAKDILVFDFSLYYKFC